MRRVAWISAIGAFGIWLTACEAAPIQPTIPTTQPAPATAVITPTSDEPTSAAAATPTARPATLETGMKVDVGGYQLYIRCTGKGTPPAIFDAGASGSSSVWRAVEPEVATLTRTCVYDRANRGSSDKGPMPNTSQQMVHDLHTLLTRVQVTGPFVLVGQSFGGMNMGLYARLFPSDAAGLVMVDAVHEAAYIDQSLTGCPYRECNGVDYTESGRQVAAAPPMPDIPLIVLQHGRPGIQSAAQEARWPAWQQELASRSPRGKLILAERSTHNIHQDQPDLVIAAVRELVEQTRH